MPRYFTLAQAQRLLPEVGAAIRQAVAQKDIFQTADNDLQNALRRIAMLGGTLVERDRVMELKSRREVSASQLKEAIETVHSFGCLVKDLDTGLVDFPTLYRGAEVYLCWRMDEPSIEFWHAIEDGFRGRKPIDQEFLDNHRGERTN